MQVIRTFNLKLCTIKGRIAFDYSHGLLLKALSLRLLKLSVPYSRGRAVWWAAYRCGSLEVV